MASVRCTRDLFLWCMAAIYMFAFTSVFVQIPGLYGDNGILPVKLALQKLEKDAWLGVLTNVGLTAETGLDLLCLGGTILSFVAMICGTLRNSFTFALLWVFYLSVFQVGQTFLWFQWDILLLEAGFLSIIVAPLNLFGWYHRHDGITLWLVKWLLFRLMFASGIVKLTSQCPTWWGLTALNYHYETQCIATPLSWYAHQLPEWFHKLGVAAVYVIEIALPFLFFSPVKIQRLVAAYAQILFMVVIQLTGNYNFFNLLTIALCVAVLDDVHLLKCISAKLPLDTREDIEKIPVLGTLWRPVKWALNLIVFGGIVYWSGKLFNLRVNMSPFSIESKIMFTSADLDKFLVTMVPVTIWLGALSLSWEVIKAITSSLVCEKGIITKLYSVAGCVLFGIIAVVMFSISLVDHTVIESNAYNNLPPLIHGWHSNVQKYELTSSYGLFRRMTGVGGRPEVIIEGSDAPDGPWREYNFLYKPGNVSEAPRIVAPHQPRLDWQMWFAALGHYQHNPWFLNLIYRLFNNQKEVLELMGTNPFADKPPSYIRATLYHYHFTSINSSHSSHSETAWWTRKKVSEYLPAIARTDTNFNKYIKEGGIIEASAPKAKEAAKPSYLQYAMTTIRQIIGQPDGVIACVSLFITAFVLSFLDPTLKLLTNV